jgi:hypothetical protein
MNRTLRENAGALLTALTSSQFPVNDLAGRTSCDAAIGTGRSDHDPVH